MCWSGGKDSAWALRELRADPRFDVRGLISLVNEKNGRVIQHGVRHSLLQRQAEAVGLPLQFLPLDPTATTTERNAALALGFGELRRREAACVAFGDLFPLWGRDTRVHADAVLEAGLSAWVCSVDTDFLPADRVGRRFDAAFVAGLPTGVDPCGGDDEFHTVVEWAPGWNRRVWIKPTHRIEAYNFAFAEMERRSRDADASPHDVFGRFARLDRVRGYVDGHLAEDLNAASAAKVAAMSPTGFSRYFREHVGTTFTSWLTQRRVEHACHLLRENNDVAVSRVAEAVGFHSERTFRRHFHEQMGLSPSEYRKRALEEASEAGSSRPRRLPVP
ncbi:MAG: helix-turn-helix domain-containing protein [Acidobacteriota bacterium]|nr:helix-turn-helix domain-containing protein [Acidobacteriota bacterium]